jgi:putative MATE family efflux protein
MHDMTQGSITRHLLRMAAPIAIGMLFQTLYYLIDLYFVARLGDSAVAGVSAGGSAQFIVMALTQVLGVGTMALIAHAVGRKDQADANLIFNQSLLMAALCALLVLVGGYALTPMYMHALGADAATTAAGISFLHWFLPGMALQFALIAMGSALRGTGVAQPTMVVQMITVLLNALLAPILIGGWLTGYPMGVAGAGLASSLSIAVGVIMLWLYFRRLEKYVAVDRMLLSAQPEVWKRILRIGLPPGGEFALMFVYLGVVYWLIRGFGADAQAGFGIGMRVMQAIFLPAMAIAFATAPIAGQNMGAGHAARVRAVFASAAWIGSAIMVLLTLLCQWRPDLLVGSFTQDPGALAVAIDYLQIISWNFVASSLIFSCSGMFQALGNTLPSLISSGTRLVSFVLPAVWLSHQSGFNLHQLWLVSVASATLQALISLWLLRREFQLRFAPVPAT